MEMMISIQRTFCTTVTRHDGVFKAAGSGRAGKNNASRIGKGRLNVTKKCARHV